MDYLLSVGHEQYLRTRDPDLLNVLHRAEFCYRKWNDTSDYDCLLRMIHREPLFGLAPIPKPKLPFTPRGYRFASRTMLAEAHKRKIIPDYSIIQRQVRPCPSTRPDTHPVGYPSTARPDTHPAGYP
jgi:hypothetical protein